MRSFQDTFETRKQSFISAFSICMTVTFSILIFYLISLNLLVLNLHILNGINTIK